MNHLKSIYRIYPGGFTKAYVFARARMLHLDKLNQYLPKTGHIFDIGCGYGISSYFFAMQNTSRKIIGLDIDQKRIILNKRIFSEISNLQFKQQDFRLDTSIGKADGIVMYDLLHHVPFATQKDLIKSARKKLKKGGVLLIKDIDRSKPIKTFFTWVLDKLMTKFEPVYYQKADDLKNLIKNEKFDVEYQELKSILPFPHYLLVCRPK